MEFKYRYLIFLAVFCLAIIYVQGEASASFYSTSFSANGKVLIVNKINVKPDYNGGIHVKKNYDPFGNVISSYDVSNFYGTDSYGRKVNQTNTYPNGVLTSSKFYLASGTFLWSSTIRRSSSTKLTENIVGKLNSKTSFSGNSIYTLSNGKFQNRITSLIFKVNGIKVSTSTITSTMSYTNGGSFNRWTETMKTIFTNGNTRTSKITTVYNRNSYGVCTGLVTSGFSNGNEKVGTKRTSYTGKISMGGKWMQDEGWNVRNYKETKTSSSPTLTKTLPYEAILYDKIIQQRYNPICYFPGLEI